MRLAERKWRRAPLRPLLAKELREITSGRSLWLMLLLTCPLVGYSFFQALALYAEASVAGADSPVLAASLSPLDGILVPTFGASYVAVTLLFPFVAIRVLSHERQSGALRLLVQLPYSTGSLVSAKMAAIILGVLLVSVPALSSIPIWLLLGGHIHHPETWTLVLGHMLYGSLVGAIGLFSAAISESAATAAIITLTFTIGSWILDFTLAGRPGLFHWIASLSLTQTLKPFEQGLLSAGVVLGMLIAITSFCTLTAVWLRVVTRLRVKLARSAAVVCIGAAALLSVAQVHSSIDVTEDRRNSFPAADQRQLAQLSAPLTITVHLAPEDPRYTDVRRNVLSKLERVMPNVSIELGSSGRAFGTKVSDADYGQLEYTYANKSDVSRSTSPREILPIIYGLAGVAAPGPEPGGEYPGYPLTANTYIGLIWFFGLLPMLVLLAWFWSRRAPRFDFSAQQGAQG